MMNEYLLEPFLTQYYLLEAVCENFLTEKARRKMFYELAELFGLGGEEALKGYYETSELPHFAEVKNNEAYERLCRTIEFAQRSGQQVELTAEDRMILAQKRDAMVIKEELFKKNKNLTKETVSSILLTTAMNGNVDAMAALAYMEYHGLCVCKDRHNALKRIRLCAKWNHLFGILMGIAYDEDKQMYYDILYTVFRNASQKQVFEQICRKKPYKKDVNKNLAARITEKAFGLGIVKRNCYDHIFAKVVFSEIISAEDKEKLLLNKQKDAIAALSDLPFDLSGEQRLAFDEGCIEGIPLRREKELRKIMQNMKVAERCSAAAYAPLLIVARDEYVAEMYGQMVKDGLDRSAVVEIDAATLTPQDFAGGRENAFLRGLSETKNGQTVFLLKHCESLDENQAEELMKVLDYHYRRKFKLFHPPVSLDLSELKFVLIGAGCTAQVKRLAERCDTVWAERITAAEKGAVVESVFRARAHSFGCDGMTLEAECKDYLSDLEPHRVRKILDSALRAAVFEERAEISLSDIKAVCDERNESDPKRDFGYTGGNKNAKNRLI